MADGRHVGKYSKCHNSPTNGPTATQLGWSHPIMPRHVRHDAVAMATAVAYQHCTFSSYGRLEGERVNQFWWNLVYNSKLGPQWQSRDQILQFLKLKMADGRHVRKYEKCHNSPTNWPTETQLGYSDPIMSPTCSPRFGCHGDGRC